MYPEDLAQINDYNLSLGNSTLLSRVAPAKVLDPLWVYLSFSKMLQNWVHLLCLLGLFLLVLEANTSFTDSTTDEAQYPYIDCH